MSHQKCTKFSFILRIIYILIMNLYVCLFVVKILLKLQKTFYIRTFAIFSIFLVVESFARFARYLMLPLESLVTELTNGIQFITCLYSYIRAITRIYMEYYLKYLFSLTTRVTMYVFVRHKPSMRFLPF